MLEGPLDQTLRLKDEDRKVFDDVDNVIGRSITAGDPVIALEYGRDLLTRSQVQGLALAKMLYKLRESWALFEASGTGDTLEAMAVVHMGRSAQTVTKYIRLWENVFANETIPDNIRQQLMGRPIKDLLLITAMAREGADEDTLKRIVAAPDHNSVRDIVRGERGPRSSSEMAVVVNLEMRRNAANPIGTLTIGREEFGHLDVENPHPRVKAAIARLVQSAGIREKFE
jgi:hypothetical protein